MPLNYYIKSIKDDGIHTVSVAVIVNEESTTEDEVNIATMLMEPVTRLRPVSVIEDYAVQLETGASLSQIESAFNLRI